MHIIIIFSIFNTSLYFLFYCYSRIFYFSNFPHCKTVNRKENSTTYTHLHYAVSSSGNYSLAPKARAWEADNDARITQVEKKKIIVESPILFGIVIIIFCIHNWKKKIINFY